MHFSSLKLAKQAGEDTLSLIPEDDACVIEEEITRQIYQEDSSYTDLLKKLKPSSVAADAQEKGNITCCGISFFANHLPRE